MSGVKRRLFNVLAAVSLVLFVVSVMSWCGSFWWNTELGYLGERNSLVAEEWHGKVGFYWMRWSATDNVQRQTGFSFRLSGIPDHYLVASGPLASIGFGSQANRTLINGITYDESLVVVPYYSLLLPTLVMPSLWFWRRLRTTHFGPMQCRGCGYDLRATPDRCPECGAAVGPVV
jgi:hypothetical protein